ncbi:putative endonuclease [Synechococcus phage DSL-LC03]|nr:putative endonuclease [Synechococcus phage DSL-LC03]
MTTTFQNMESFNDDADACIFQRYGKPVWYLRILKKPGWKSGGHWSLKTKNKDEAIIEAKKKYQDLMGVHQVLKNSLFNDEDVKIATLKKGLGRICEDKFKNMMLVLGYQVYTPVEDIWGSDFIISKDGKKYERVQVKSTAQTGKMSFHLMTGHAHKQLYKHLVDYMAFISIIDDAIWLVPAKDLPDKTGMTLSELKKNYEKFKISYVGV